MRYDYWREGDVFMIYDAVKGRNPSLAIARCWDVAEAEKIVKALNASEPMRAKAA